MLLKCVGLTDKVIIRRGFLVNKWKWKFAYLDEPVFQIISTLFVPWIRQYDTIQPTLTQEPWISFSEKH
jgi:hypothetical protein